VILFYRDPLERQLASELSPDLLMEHVRRIAAWERESGTDGEARAFDYIEGVVKQAGLDVERREIEAFISLPQHGRVLLPGGEAIEGLTHSFSTSTEGLEAELVDVGDGRSADYERAGGCSWTPRSTWRRRSGSSMPRPCPWNRAGWRAASSARSKIYKRRPGAASISARPSTMLGWSS
jgi:hypothetical protein